VDPKPKPKPEPKPEPEPEPEPKIEQLDSEFNSIHFGIEINKRLKSLKPRSFSV